jgi:hypothetical protein
VLRERLVSAEAFRFADLLQDALFLRSGDFLLPVPEDHEHDKKEGEAAQDDRKVQAAL